MGFRSLRKAYEQRGLEIDDERDENKILAADIAEAREELQNFRRKSEKSQHELDRQITKFKMLEKA